MTCDQVRAAMTAYLDGELATGEGDRGSAVRGHLRSCQACREIAQQEARVRDELRALAPVDPPTTMWAGVQAKLAAAEVTDAQRPAWRRAWARWSFQLPRLAVPATAFAAAVAAFVIWHAHDRHAATDAPVIARASEPASVPVRATEPAPAVTPAPADSDDVSDQVAADPARETAAYAASAARLREQALTARAGWAEERKASFDHEIAALDHEVAARRDDRSRQRAYRTMIRFLQRAAIRDEVALADVPTAGGAR